MANKFIDTSFAYPRASKILTFGETYAECVAEDLGKAVVGGTTGDTGILMYYDNTAKKWWVMQDEAGDVWDEAGGEAITITSGTGSGTTTGAATDTYNGDGTVVTPATSSGGTGSWNTISVMSTAPSGLPGGAGSVSNGDVVYLRSANVIGNNEVTFASTLTMLARGTRDLPIWWIVDDGTYFPHSGTLTFSFNDGRSFAAANLNHLYGGNRKWHWKHNVTGGYGTWCTWSNNIIDGVIFEVVNDSAANSFVVWYFGSTGQDTWFRNCKLESARDNGGTYPMINIASSSGYIRMDGCEFDITGIANSAKLFYQGAGNTQVYVNGGRVIGGNSTNYLIYADLVGTSAIYGLKFLFDNFDYGPLQFHTLSNWTSYPTQMPNEWYEYCAANAAGTGKFYKVTQSLITDYNPDGNYPTLNSQLPGVETAWSIRCQPRKLAAAGGEHPYMGVALNKIVKRYTSADDQLDITAEMLLCDDFATPTKWGFWIDVYYTDEDDVSRWETTRALTGNLATSSATWTSETYGAQAYSPYKITLSTTYAVKQHTDITLMLRTVYQPPAADDYFFICPDFVIEAS